MNGPPKSPLTGTDNVREVDSFSASDIAELYSLQEGVDVARFFGNVDRLRLFECGDTGFRFFYPFEIVGDEKFYQDLQAAHDLRGQNYDREWSPDHQTALDHVSANDELLEIGCNRGKFLVRAREKAARVAGLEFNELAAAEARAKGLDVAGDSITKHADENPGRYDVVCAFQVLEHVLDAGAFIAGAVTALRPGGKLIFSVPNNEPYFQRFSKFETLNLPPHHVGLWNLDSFRRAAPFFGLELSAHEFHLPSGFRVEVYLRAKMLAGVKSLPRRHSLGEKFMIVAMAPFAAAASALDSLRGLTNFAHVTVVFRKS